MQVVVIGGGVAGLAAALALSRDGHDVEVFEGDAAPLPADPLIAFESWERRGAPQVWHSHAFLARLRNLLRDDLPDVYQALLAHGCYEVRFGDSLPPTLADFEPEPDDERLTLLACRRITFEWVVRRIVEDDPRIRWHGGVRVSGLLASPEPGSPPRVHGVQVAGARGSREVQADAVIDASGRRSLLPRWLQEIGAAAPEEEAEDCGIFYCSRFYRLREGATPPPGATLIGSDLGYMKYAIFPGDSRIFSLTLAASPNDEPLRAILRPRAFEAAARAIPMLHEWIRPERAEPVSPVRAMRSLRNRRLRLVCDGRPVALGVHAIGDAAIGSNPLYGRGCALAFIHAWLLRDVLRDSAADAERQALELHEATEREIGPWYLAARDQDREARRIADEEQRGEAPVQALGSKPGEPVDPRAFMRSVLRDGLLPALRTDAVVLRAFAKVFNLLTPPDSLMTDPDVMQRILRAWRERDTRAPEERLGPARTQMVQLLADVA